MSAKLSELMLRIRKQTLRSNLCQAYRTLEDLPSHSLQLDKIKDALAKSKELLEPHAAEVSKYARLGKTKDAYFFLFDLKLKLEAWNEELEQIGRNSFLAQVKSSGVTGWRAELQERAECLQEKLNLVNSWSKLIEVEAEARKQVFGRSIELLGGIALRDARLNSEVCEFADELLKAISPLEPKHYAILGGLSIMLMELERIVRLPFPQWSVWALPFAAHELWDANRAGSTKVRERVIQALPPDQRQRLAAITDDVIDECLADAFATFVVGPAFGYAAITLWFDPSEPQYDHRVRIIQAMLRAMNKGAGGAGETYQQVSDGLGDAWLSAPGRSARAAVVAGCWWRAVSDGLRDAWLGAPGRLAEANGIVPVEDDAHFDAMCASMINELQRLTYKGFPLADWLEVKRSRKDVLEAEHRSHDIRHILNAGWLARIELDSDDDGDLTLKVTERLKKLLKPAEDTIDSNLPPAGPN